MKPKHQVKECNVKRIQFYKSDNEVQMSSVTFVTESMDIQRYKDI